MFNIMYVFVHNSVVRQIPDNQEVFAHPATDQSVIIELMEAVDPQEPDEVAIKFVFIICLVTFLTKQYTTC